jgi:hypothetical protein
MKICMWGAAAILLTCAVAQATDGAGAGRQAEVSVFSAENLAAETPLTATMFPEGTGPRCVASEWQRFRHGCLWDDYCLQKQFGAAVCAPAERCPEDHPASWLRTLWPWRSAPQKPCRTCYARRTPALDALCHLLGWQRCTPDRVACHARIDCPEPAASVHFDDPAPLPPAPLLPAPLPPAPLPPAPLPPAPLPPAPLPLTTPDEPLGDANVPMDPSASESPPVEPVPIPEETLDPDGASGEMELSPAPADDPAPEPEPQPEIPRNKLPKPQPTNSGTSRVSSGRTVVAVRLSDYIRTR